MTNASVRETDLGEPAVRPELLDEPGADGVYLSAQEAGGVEQVARVPKDVVAPEVRPGIPLGPSCLLARLDHRLESVGRGVAVGRVAIPGLERNHLTHLLADKLAGEGDALVEALLGADLDDEP